MSVLTQFYGGGGGIGTVYTYTGSFTVSGSSILHTHNQNLTNGYHIPIFCGLNTGGSAAVYFNINSSVPTDPFSGSSRGGPVNQVTWDANSSRMACGVGGNQASGSIQILS